MFSYFCFIYWNLFFFFFFTISFEILRFIFRDSKLSALPKAYFEVWGYKYTIKIFSDCWPTIIQSGWP